MNNNVVLTICHAVTRHSIAAFRFNFCGVGASQGDFGEGIGEQEDLKAALAFMAADARVNKNRLGVGGYSFGSTVAAPVAASENGVKALALVSPPLQGPGLRPLKDFARPKLILCGDHDFVVPEEQLQAEVKGLPPPIDCEIVNGTDHFWWGQERLLTDKIGGFFGRSL